MNVRLQNLVRDIQVGQYLENFFVSTVFSIVIIRIYLRVFDYPLIGKGNIHIAHMLFGGFIMFFAIILLLTFLNREIKNACSIIGGIGFGMFIDEFGKFITKDNNYFYQPAIAIVYIILVSIFITFRTIEKRIDISPKEYAVNALEYAKEAILRDLDVFEKKLTLDLIRQSGLKDPVLLAIEEELNKIPAKRIRKDGILLKTKLTLTKLYRRVVRNKFFSKFIIIVFAVKLFFSIIPSWGNIALSSSFFDWGELVTALLSLWLVVIAFFKLRKRNMLSHFRILRLAVLNSIFLSQFFVFYRQQFSALIGLCLDIALLSTLEYAISQKILTSRMARK